MKKIDRYFNHQEKIFKPKINLSDNENDVTIIWDSKEYRTDQLSNKYYGTPFFDFIIKEKNAHLGVDEWEWENGSLITIPLPLNRVVQEYFNFYKRVFED